jgi:hypothetical protein
LGAEPSLLPQYLAWHVLLSAPPPWRSACVVSLPLAILAHRRPRLRWIG